MPRTHLTADAGFKIVLDSPKPTYLVGDVLQGRVVLSSPKTLLVHSVKLSLFGRAKTKIIKPDGYQGSPVYYRGRAVFFDQRETLMSTKTPNMTPAEHAWPFKITIPKHPHKSIRTGYHWQGAFSYLSTDTDVTQHELPGSFYFLGDGFTAAEAYVEYALVATLSGKRLPEKLCKATLPLRLRKSVTQTPISDNKCAIRSFGTSIKTLKLLPEHTLTRSFILKQKMKSLFRSYLIPKYLFTIKVEYPSIIQIDHPEPIPFRIWVVPGLCKDQANVSQEDDLPTIPRVKLLSISLKLKSTIRVRAPYIIRTTESQKTLDFSFSNMTFTNGVELPVLPRAHNKVVVNDSNSADLPLSAPRLDSPNARIKTADNPLPPCGEYAIDELQSLPANLVPEQPSTHPVKLEPTPNRISSPDPTQPTQTNTPEPLNIGQIFFPRLTRTHSYIKPPSSTNPRKTYFVDPLCPTSSTYNISVSHEWHFKLHIACADDDFIVKSHHKHARKGCPYLECVVLDRSEEQVLEDEKHWDGKECKRDWNEVTGRTRATARIGSVTSMPSAAIVPPMIGFSAGT